MRKIFGAWFPLGFLPQTSMNQKRGWMQSFMAMPFLAEARSVAYQALF
jgi:hypothetical protein